VRLGSLHRNTFVDSPRILRPTLQLMARDDLFLAGQMIGVEGYVESAAAGLLAGINAAHLVMNRELVVPPPESAAGSIIAYITDRARRDFQPMNANYGLMPDLKIGARGQQKKVAMGARAIAAIDGWIERNRIESDLVEPAAAMAARALRL
jgi:methylenetetrahydrofolate--tRNA-(uracil-5-)-methyltransferase